MRRPLSWLSRALEKLGGKQQYELDLEQLLTLRPGEYDRWIAEHDTLSPADCEQISDAVERLIRRPLISVIIVGDSAAQRVEQSIESLRVQLYPHWELCIVGSRSAPQLYEQARTASDIRLALLQARGEYVTVVESGDRLSPHALYVMVAELSVQPDADLVYSDEDEIDDAGKRQRPYFKSDWNADLFLAQDFACRLALVPVGGAKAAAMSLWDEAAGYDLILRVLDRRPEPIVRHTPFVLYHRRAGRRYTAREQKAACLAVEAHFKRRVGDQRKPAIAMLPSGHRQIAWPVPTKPPKVSLIVPTRDHVELLRNCIEGLRHRTDYPSLEIIIIDNGSKELATSNYIRSIEGDGRVRVLQFPHEFNYSEINNFGVRHARGDVIGLLNNDLQVIDEGWLKEMVGHALRPEIGAVGALLYYGNGKVQHAGCVLGIGGVASHVYKGQPADHQGHGWRMRLAQNLSAVTAACLITRRDVWDRVGGLNPELRVAYNDIDFCLRVTEAGYRIVWTPFARLYHLESASRGSDKTPQTRARLENEKLQMVELWGNRLIDDPYYSPNLSLTNTDCRLAFPPRSIRSWRLP